MVRFVFVTGGVVSSLGKGIAAASLAALLQARGYRVRLRKLDPYINVDPGTMSPYEHGEVYVTEDGAETDLDLGHYERFSGVKAAKGDNVTSGKIYQDVLSKERRGDYLGGTVQVIPHVTDQIKQFIVSNTEDLDFLICEIGGTVGDIEGLPFLEAIRQLRNDLGWERTLYLHLTLLPYIKTAKELKTKPTQHSVKELLSLGIQPDMLLCRTEIEMSLSERRKLALFCNVPAECVMEARDVPTIYQVPLNYHKEGLDTQVCQYFSLQTEAIDLSPWEKFVHGLETARHSVTIAIVGKYVDLPDAYRSISESLLHAGVWAGARVQIKWVHSESIENDGVAKHLSDVDGLVVAGGFGVRGTEGKMSASAWSRLHKVPFLGICFGLQMAIVEFARNVLHLKGAGSTEIHETVNDPVVGLMTEWARNEGFETRSTTSDLGGTMRLGAYPCHLKPGTRAREIYGQDEISERHRHRYEVNVEYRERYEAAGLIFSGMSPDGRLPEIVELKDHPYFIAVQFHPEFKSGPFAPHPLFKELIRVAVQEKERKH